MTDRLIPELKYDEKGNWIYDEYTVYIENSLPSHDRNSYRYFFDRYIKRQEILFNIPEKEEDILEFYSSLKYKLPNLPKRNIVKLFGSFYKKSPSGNIWNKDSTKLIWIERADRIDVNYYHPQAIKNLMQVLYMDKLDLPEKSLVKDIAKESFLFTLDLAADSTCEKYSLEDCLRLDRNEYALEKLRAFGFTVKSKRFLDVDLRQEKN